MATKVDNSTFIGLDEQMTDNLIQGITQGPTITLDANVKKTKKVPLTFEELLSLIQSGNPLPEDAAIPSLTMEQMSKLPGGATAIQNIAGLDQMSAIKTSANFGQGPGGTTPEQAEEPEEESSEIAIHSCPAGYRFDTIQKICIPVEDRDREGEAAEAEQAAELLKKSYASFANTIMNSDSYKSSNGTWDDFKKNMDQSWMGSGSKFFFKDNEMLYDAWQNSFGTNLNLLGQKQKGMLPTDVYTTTKYKPLSGAMAITYPQFTAPSPQKEEPVRPDSGDTYTSIKDSVPSQTFDPPNYTSVKDSVPSQTFDKPSSPYVGSLDKAEQSAKDKANFSANIKGNVFGRPFQEGGLVNQPNTARPLQLSDVSLEMQEGGQVPVAPPQEAMPMPSGQPAGFVNDPSAAPAPDNTMDAMQGEGQKDDVMGELPEGTFVINAMAVQLAGIEELDNMVEKAYETLSENMREKGVDENLVTQLVGSSRSRAGMKEQMIDVAVSNGEYIVPPEIVPIIGEDKLRKINDRGLRKLEKEKKQEKKQPQAPMMMDKGGFVIATDPDGKILTEKVKDESGREVSRILSRDEVGSAEERAVQQGPRDGGSYQDVSTKDISKSKSFVRRKGVDEYIENDPRQMKSQGFSTPVDKYVDPEQFEEPEYNQRMIDERTGKFSGTPSFADVDQTKENIMQKKVSIPETSDPVKKELVPGKDFAIAEEDVKGFMGVSPIKTALTKGQQLKAITNAYKNGNVDFLNLVMEQGESKSLATSFDEDIRVRARDYYLDLTSGKTVNNKTTEEKALDAQTDETILNNNNLKGINAGDFNERQNMPERLGALEQRLYSNKPFVEPKNQTIQKNQTMQNIENPIEQMYKDKNLGNLAETGDRTKIIPTDELTEQLQEMDMPNLNTMLQPDVFNEYSKEDRKKIIAEFMRRMTVSSANFGVRALPVSTQQEPRNADDLFTRKGDFPNIIDPNDGVALNQLFLRLLEKETTNLNDKAVSPKGAVGLSQLMPDTIKDPGSGLIELLDRTERQFIDPKIVGDKPLTDNDANLLFGNYYLKALLLYYNGDVSKALSAYNYGLGATNKLIEKHKGAWATKLPSETEDYIRTIKGNLPTEIPLPKPNPKRRVGGFV